MITAIRPSKLGLAVKCPASTIPPEAKPETSPQAERGQYLHTLLSPSVHLPETLSAREYRMMESARAVIPQNAEFPEKPLPLTIRGVDLSGTPDCLWMEDGRVFVVDLKTGETPVQTVRNYQLAAYALAAMAYKKSMSYKVAIIQPHIQPVVWVEGYLETLNAHMRAAVESIKQNQSLENCGEWCDSEYCPRKSECPTYRRERAELVDCMRTSLAVRQFSELIPAEQIEVQRKARMAKEWLDGILSEFRKNALSGVYGDAVEVKTIAGNRKISDAQKAYALSELGAESFMKCVDVSYSELVKAMTAAVRPNTKTKKEAEDIVRQKLEPVTERGAEKVTIKVKGE